MTPPRPPLRLLRNHVPPVDKRIDSDDHAHSDVLADFQRPTKRMVRGSVGRRCKDKIWAPEQQAAPLRPAQDFAAGVRNEVYPSF